MTDRPLYLRIADEIAGDIRGGRLAEGQPAPSTRRIVRDWNVAMATATKAIGALREAGLVETIPGSGTIVRHRSQLPATAARSARLSQREIVDAGVRIADADGLPLVTMRRVADSLGVSTMALYRHVPNKGDLTLRMADSVFGGIRLPVIPIADWRRRLDAGAHLFWSVFSRHPWAAEVISLSRPQPMPNVMPFAEWSLSTLRAMGFGPHDMLCAHINLFAHVRGMALARLEEAQAEKDTGMSADDWMSHNGRGLRQWADSAGHPGLGYAIREPFDFDLDTVFEYGLQRLLDGIDARRRALLGLVLRGCAWGDNGYAQRSKEMLRLAADQPGFLGIDSSRGADGFGVTVSYWRDEESISAWRHQADHARTRADGRAHWYDSIAVHVARVERSYGFDR